MSTFTIALLGSFSRLFFSSPSDTRLGISTIQSDSDLAAAHTHIRPPSLESMRTRPSSAIEGYTSRGVPTVPADVKITHASPVLACQPPRVHTPSPLDDGPACPPEPRHLHDVLRGARLRIRYLVHPPTTSSAHWAGYKRSIQARRVRVRWMGIVSFGCDAAEEAGARKARRGDRGLSRRFLEEAAWTWAADPHHQMLTIIEEGEEEPEEEPPVPPSPTQAQEMVKTKKSGTRSRTRDLST
ncbi:hypothetical protein B0H11DRAFT_2206048, partial [Mycena galericulata]